MAIGMDISIKGDCLFDLLNHQYLTAIASSQTERKLNVHQNKGLLLLEDADYDGHSLSMLQKITGALNQKVEIKFLAIAP